MQASDVRLWAWQTGFPPRALGTRFEFSKLRLATCEWWPQGWRSGCRDRPRCAIDADCVSGCQIPAGKGYWTEMSEPSFERENIGLESLTADSVAKPLEP